jgi:hypothetical protein
MNEVNILTIASLPKNYFTSLKMCTDSLQTGCLCSWRTLNKGYIPHYLKNENGKFFCYQSSHLDNSEEYASKQFNKGSALTKFNKVYEQANDAQLYNGLLWIKSQNSPGVFYTLPKIIILVI